MRNIFVAITAIMLYTIGSVSAQENPPIAQINGQDVAQPADTVINPPSYGSDLQGVLLDSGISFILIKNRSDGVADTVTVFKKEDVAIVCGWEKALTDDIRLVFNGAVEYCSN